MTRYARAKGSKASNERLPNDATPWHVMRQQLAESKSKAPSEKKKSAKELLRDQDAFNSGANANAQEWAEFEDNRSKSNAKKQKNSNSNRNLSKNDVASESNNDNVQTSQETGDAKAETTDRKTTKEPKKKKRAVDNSNSVSGEKELNPRQDTNYIALSKRQKRNQKRKLEMSNNGSKRFKQDTPGKSSNAQTREEKMKKKREYKRRKPDAGVTKIIINGVETEIVMYDGFPVKKEDAERLAELKQKMIMKGIPKSEVDMAMKLERRRAEKALARVKKLVCFNCRKSGHNLSECPELDRDEATGICFKCGSTEHTHFECKVKKDSSYGFAKCFICREQGHIASQCPDNPTGVYPHGGCCKICGAVTHLKKDCPDLVNAKEESAVTVEKMNDSAVESLQEDMKEKCEKESKKPSKNKIIKF